MDQGTQQARVSQESVAIDGIQMRFEHTGQGAPLVLVHGLLGYSFSWRRVLPLFAPFRESFAVDMPCSGFSGCNPTLDATLASTATRLLKFLDVVKIDRCDLIGSSYGGSTSLMLAAMRPERVRSLTLVSPANPWSSIGKKRLALLSMPVIGNCFPIMARALPVLHRYSVKRMYGDPRKVTRETLAGYSRPLQRRGVFEHAVKIAQVWHTNMEALESALTSAVVAPTLIVWGDQDRMVSVQSAAVLSRKLGNAPVVVMPGAGHLPYEECPGEFATIVLEFLGRHPPPEVPHGR